MVFTIDNEKCTFCGLCASDCPSKVILIDRSSKTAEIDSRRCIECSHCGMICPAGAVSADGEELPPYPAEAGAASDVFEHLLLSKRSIRKYSERLPAQSDIEAILRSGALTATASNSRQVDSIIIQGPEVRKTTVAIARTIRAVLRLVRNPLIIGILKCSGLKRYANKHLLDNFYNEMKNIIDGKSDVLFFNAPVVVILTYSAGGKMFGRTDCALAGQSMMLTAHNRGIGSCMIGFAETALRIKALRKKIGIPPDRRIGLIFTLGYTDRQYFRYPARAEWKI